MQQEKLLEYREWIRKELGLCLDFWLKNAMNGPEGGISTCLDREGKRVSEDQGVWMQGRAAWMFSHLCGVYGKRPEWLAAAKSCIDYMENACFDRAKGRMYLAVRENGEPVSQSHQCFSEGFYTMANAEYSAAAGDAAALERAKHTYDLIWKLNNGLMEDPNGSGPKTELDGRPGRALADPMIYLNITAVMRRCDPAGAPLYDERSAQCVADIFRYHLKPELQCTLEKVGMRGEICAEDGEGRVVNPGHDIECVWFLLDEANYRTDIQMRRQAEQMFNYAMEAGWDLDYGGLISFLDGMGRPLEMEREGPGPENKVWWPQCEALIASLMLYRDTGDEKYGVWFEKELDYCRRVFSDPTYGEWYSARNQDGSPMEQTNKGNIFKGPFHLPRMLVRVEGMLTELLER